MKITIVKAITLTVAIASLAAGAALAQTKPFSAAPDIPPHYYQLNSGDNLQQFNGRFVQRLIRQIDNTNIRSCLRSLDTSPITVEAYSEGAVVTDAGGCAGGSFTQSVQQSGNVTSKIATSAKRALAVVLAKEKFNQEAFFQRNDRNLANYDVNIFDKNGKIYISFLPLPDNVNRSVAGCPSTGPIAVTYIVDPQTLSIRRGNMAC
jgi:hypothetical protein